MAPTFLRRGAPSSSPSSQKQLRPHQGRAAPKVVSNRQGPMKAPESQAQSKKQSSTQSNCSLRTAPGDRLWPSPPIGDDRFGILPKVGSARNADVNSLYYRFRAHSGRGARSSKPVAKWKRRPEGEMPIIKSGHSEDLLSGQRSAIASERTPK